MCYHEQLIFSCGCKMRNIVPCPRRLPLERNSTVNWRRVHKLTRICPKLEHDQLHIDIDCEVCGLIQQDVKPFTAEYDAYAHEHGEMHQRLLGKTPRYIMLIEPAWDWWWGRHYSKRDQVLVRRAINAQGVHLVKSDLHARHVELESWKAQGPAAGYAQQPAPASMGYANMFKAQSGVGGGGMQGQATDMSYGRWKPVTVTNNVASEPNILQRGRGFQTTFPQTQQLPQRPTQSNVPMYPMQPVQFRGHGFPHPDQLQVDQRAYQRGWQGPQLAPRHFTAPPIPPYNNPFVSAAMNYKKPWPTYEPFANPPPAVARPPSNRPTVPAFNNISTGRSSMTWTNPNNGYAAPTQLSNNQPAMQSFNKMTKSQTKTSNTVPGAQGSLNANQRDPQNGNLGLLPGSRTRYPQMSPMRGPPCFSNGATRPQKRKAENVQPVPEPGPEQNLTARQIKRRRYAANKRARQDGQSEQALTKAQIKRRRAKANKQTREAEARARIAGVSGAGIF